LRGPRSTRYTISGGKWSDVAEIIVTGPGRNAVKGVPDLPSGCDDLTCQIRFTQAGLKELYIISVGLFDRVKQ
jgi:hypothetical protein